MHLGEAFREVRLDRVWVGGSGAHAGGERQKGERGVYVFSSSFSFGEIVPAFAPAAEEAKRQSVRVGGRMMLMAADLLFVDSRHLQIVPEPRNCNEPGDRRIACPFLGGFPSFSM